jgi:hypothetical protein
MAWQKQNISKIDSGHHYKKGREKMKLKMRPKKLLAALGTLLSLFLLINIFCIDQSFGKKPTDDATYAKVWVEFSPYSPITISPNPSIPYCNDFGARPGKPGPAGVMTFTWDVDLDYFVSQTFKEDGDGTRCFGNDGTVYGLGLTPIVPGDDDSIIVVINFHSSFNDNPSDLGYRLLLYGIPQSPFPPPVPDTSTIIDIYGWEIETAEGKGTQKRISCTGSSALIDPDFQAFPITVYRGENDPDCTNTP